MRFFHSVLLVALLCILYACGHDKDDSFEVDRPAVEAALSTSLSQLPPGWPTGLDCDGLLWAGLAAGAGAQVDLLQARSEDGRWHRRQVSDGFCLDTAEAKSEISRDMLLGLLVGLQEQGDTASIQGVLDYAHAHDSVMGEGDRSRTIFTPNMYGVYERAVGNSDSLVLLFPVSADYENHLQMILLYAYNNGASGLPLHLQQFLRSLAKKYPNDAFCQAVACDALGVGCERAQSLLLDPAYTPPTYVRGPASALPIHLSLAAKALL